MHAWSLTSLPHMRYTMEINALARQSLINGGGVIEDCFTPGRYCMEISSAAYKTSWRFDMEALPADLLRRGMAVEDPSSPCGIKLVIKDYPYAADGMLVWSAIKEYVDSYVAHFYSKPGSKEDLAGILTTMMWTASGQHAAINFGQYPFGGYVPNRPTLMRKLIPQKGEPGFANSASSHKSDGGPRDDEHEHGMFSTFSGRVKDIERIVNERNQDSRNNNRCGAGIPPYELLLPTSDHGVTGRGIPNTISI
ncbi:hypothetical protein V2J09_016142 [Rumex salicifolius]